MWANRAIDVRFVPPLYPSSLRNLVQSERWRILTSTSAVAFEALSLDGVTGQCGLATGEEFAWRIITDNVVVPRRSSYYYQRGIFFCSLGLFHVDIADGMIVVIAPWISCLSLRDVLSNCSR